MREHPMQLRDLRFALYEHLDVPKATGVDREQIDLVLEASAKFARDVLAPINAKGDKHGVVRHDDGRVTSAPGYKAAFDQYREDGWSTMSAPADRGGQDLPQVVVTACDELGIGACCAFHNYVGPHARVRQHAPAARDRRAEEDVGDQADLAASGKGPWR